MFAWSRTERLSMGFALAQPILMRLEMVNYTVFVKIVIVSAFFVIYG